jgi:hypothetical protein
MKPPRAPERIAPMLDQIREIWERTPDLRLGQLLVNTINRERQQRVPHSGGELLNVLFYMEDEELLARLKKQP